MRPHARWSWQRLDPQPTLSFFTAEQAPTLRAFCDVLLAQDVEPRVPVAELVDEKLAAGRLDGYQYADMPDDRDDLAAGARGPRRNGARVARQGVASPDCAAEDQEAIVKAFAAGRLAGGAWEQLNVSRAWSVCMRMALEAFYSHPWAWNEIGFGGPAYPQGYMRLGPLERAGAARAPGRDR